MRDRSELGGISPSSDISGEAYAARMVAGQLADLERLRGLGMEMADGLTRYATGKVSADAVPAFARERDVILAFSRISRSVRQIIVLEQEIMGLRPLPDRRAHAVRDLTAQDLTELNWREAPWGRWSADDTNDLNDLNDYDDGPADAVIARVRATLASVGASVGSHSVPKPRTRGADGRFVRADSFSSSCPHVLRASTPFHDSEVSVDPRNECGDDGIREPHGRDPP